MKKELVPSTALHPVPGVLVSCTDGAGIDNIITISWIGIVNSLPPMLTMSIRKERFSHALLKKCGQFVVNLAGKSNLFALDYCGANSGRDVDKFHNLRLTKVHATKVAAPLIEECPINIECEVEQAIDLGSHEMFLSRIVAVHGDDNLVENGRLRLDDAGLVCCLNGTYRMLTDSIGTFGLSLTKTQLAS